MTESLLRTTAEHLRAADFPAALATALEVLAADPASVPALAMGALAALRLGNEEEAETLLRRQLAATPADLAARANLAGLLAERGRTTEALDLARDHAGHPRLASIAGWAFQQAGDLSEARVAYEAVVAAQPADFRVWNNLANVRLELGDWHGAITAFERSITYGANTPQVFVSLCRALRGPEHTAGRLRAAKDGLERFPGDRDLLLELAGALAAAWQTEEAIDQFKALAETEQGFGRAHYELGLYYETLARLDELDALIETADANGWQAPELDFLRAWSLHRRGDSERAGQLLKTVPETVDPMRVSQLRGLVADKLNDIDTAFDAFRAMNAAALEQTPGYLIEASSFRQFVNAGAAKLDRAARLTVVPQQASQAPDPVFLVGFPRSGTTLLETLLGALPELQGFEEMPMLAQVNADYPGIALETDAATIEDARAEYFEVAERLQGPAGSRRILDKMPLHMVSVAEIHRLFPNAQFILVERHPCDAVLSCYMATFSLNAGMRAFTDLEEAARVYDAAFSYWYRATELLPVRVHRVRYERMLADLEGEMRSLVDFLGLPWNDDLLDNVAQAERRGTVRSASYAQVGQPIYDHARERWRRYRPHLKPVLPILAPWVERLGYEL